MTMFTPDYDWTNWMGNLAARMDLYEPSTEAQLAEAVTRAVARGKVRAVGGSNAWSPLVPTTPSGGGSIISLRHMRGVKNVDATATPPTITVESGWPIKKLVKFSEKHDLTLITPTIFQEITLGGALAVGAHGTGLCWGTMSDAVESLKIVTPDGTPRTLTAADGDLFDAAVVGLGCLGVIYEVTLRCEKTFRLHVEDRLVPRDEVLSGIPDLLATYEFLELYWFPFNDMMWVKAMSRTPEPMPADLWRQQLADAANYYLTIGGAKLLPWMAKLAPSLTPTFMRLGPRLEMTPGTRVDAASDEFHYQKAYPRCWDMSWAVPLDDSERAWRDTIALVEDFAAQGKYPVNMCVHSRFIGPSRGWLAPSHGRAVCDIEIATIKGTPNPDEFFQAWTDQMLANPYARPHWGKHILSPERLKERYPKMNDFLAIKQSFDPAGAFTNDFLARRVFQEVP